MVGKKVCTRCGAPFPDTNDYFPYTTVRGKRRLRGDCKPCHALTSAAHYQKNKKKMIKEHVAYNRRYRAEHRSAYNTKRRLYNQRRRWQERVEV